jgi:hypothetical protein
MVAEGDVPDEVAISGLGIVFLVMVEIDVDD